MPQPSATVGFMRSEIPPTIAGPSVKPMIVWMNSSTEADTARIRIVATDCATANDGPKNIDASRNMIENVIGTTIVRSRERYAANWNGIITTHAMPGTHMYQR